MDDGGSSLMSKVHLRISVAFVLFMLLLAGTLSCKKGERARFEIKQGDMVKWEDALSQEQKAMLSDANGISLIAAGEDNSLWLATFDGNIFRYDGGELYGFGNLDIVPHTMFTPGDGSTWVGGELKEALPTSLMDPSFDEARPQSTGAIYRYDGNRWGTSAELVFSCNKLAGSSPSNIWAISCEEIMRFDGFQWSTVYRMGDASELGTMHPGMIPKDICVGEEGTPLVLNDEGTIVFWEDGTWRDLEIPLESEEAEYAAGLITGSLSKSVYVAAGSRAASGEGGSESTRIYQYRDGAWEIPLQVDGSKMGPIGQSEDGSVVNTQIRYPSEYLGQSSRVFLMRSGLWSEQGELGGMILCQPVLTDEEIWLSNGDTLFKGLVEDGSDQ